MVEFGGLGSLSGVLIDGLSDTTLSAFVVSNTLKCDIPVAPEIKSSLNLDTSYSKHFE
jgi:hypothetical protein